jgi:hypothetical protein
LQINLEALLLKATYEDETLPPPYKNTYTVEANLLPDGLDVSFELKYLERDTIDEQEIFAEGFTLDDDFKWKGKLKLTWKTFMEELVEKSSWKKAHKKSPLKIELKDQATSVPENLDEWLYVLQELTQAIFEEAGREAPLEVTFLKIEKENKFENSLLVSFADRNVQSIQVINGKVSKGNKSWKESKMMMELIYRADYLEEKAILKAPSKPGKFINIGEGAWYEFGVGVLNPGKKNLLNEIEKIFQPPI